MNGQPHLHMKSHAHPEQLTLHGFGQCQIGEMW